MFYYHYNIFSFFNYKTNINSLATRLFITFSFSYFHCMSFFSFLGYNTNMNSSTAQFPQSQSMHYSQKMSPFNGEGSLQQTPQMAMNQNGQYLQVRSVR